MRRAQAAPPFPARHDIAWRSPHSHHAPRLRRCLRARSHSLTMLSPCRHVILPKELSKQIPRDRLLNEQEWRQMGVQQSRGWMHYAIHRCVRYRCRRQPRRDTRTPRLTHSATCPLPASARRLADDDAPQPRAAHPFVPPPARHRPRHGQGGRGARERGRGQVPRGDGHRERPLRKQQQRAAATAAAAAAAAWERCCALGAEGDGLLVYRHR